MRDELTGATVRIRARAVVNATGAWADGLAPETRLRPSKGVHVVLPAARLGHPAASLTVPVPGEPNRYVFALPHADGLVHVGLTDDPLDGPLPDVPRADEREIAFLLDTLGRGLERPLSRSTSSARSPACVRCSPARRAAPPTCPAATPSSAATTASGPCSAASSRPTGGWRRTPSTG